MAPFDTEQLAKLPEKYRRLHQLLLRIEQPVWIVSYRGVEALAKDVAERCRQRMVTADTSLGNDSVADEQNRTALRTIQYKSVLQWDYFPDGFPNLFITEVKDMAGKDVIFIASFHSVNVLFEQVSMLYQIPRYLVHSFTIIVPYFPTGTMERIDQEGQVATAQTLASVLSNVPSTSRGPPQIVIFDIHALQERFYFSNNIIPRLVTAVPGFMKFLQAQNNDIAIVFPDEGAEKRYDSYVPSNFYRITCSKIREGMKRHVRIKEGNPSQKDVLVLDDLIQTGGTLLETGKVLKAAGAASISAYVVHAVFPNESWKKFTPETDGEETLFKTFWITDSIPHANEIVKHPPFKLFTLAPMMADLLIDYDLRQVD